MKKTSYAEIEAYTTKDGSLIRELMHPAIHGNMNLSLAQAVIEPGCTTISHVHKTSEEVYHIVQGKGIMSLGKEQFSIAPGDTVCISPNQPHSLENTGYEPLILLCCCAPPYSHGDTEMRPKME